MRPKVAEIVAHPGGRLGWVHTTLRPSRECGRQLRGANVIVKFHGTLWVRDFDFHLTLLAEQRRRRNHSFVSLNLQVASESLTKSRAKVITPFRESPRISGTSAG